MSRYTSTTDADRVAMLEVIGAGSVDELFADIPPAMLLRRPLALAPGRSEQEVYTYLRELAAANVSCENETSFLGAGMYDHYVPALIDSILSRSEFLTPYTPYQPEVSQGGLQAMFEYQTMISELTGLPVSNASVYDGPSAVAAAAYMAHLKNGRSRVVVSRGVHPHAREALGTTSAGWRATVVEVPLSEGLTNIDAVANRGRLEHVRRYPPAAELPRSSRGHWGARGSGRACRRNADRELRPAHPRNP